MAEVEQQQIGGYTLTELLRVSPTSSLYKSKQRKKDVLIKRLNISLTSTADRESFLLRAKQLKKLVDRNIIRVLDAGLDGDYAYLVLEYKIGETLEQHYPVNKQLAPDTVKQLLSPIASALNYAHVRGVLHGNLHPGTILAGSHNDTLLTDFALTPLSGSPVLDDEEFAIPYRAPEHLQGKPEMGSDQYTLAVMVYEWLCGRRPYEATERLLLLEQQQQLPIPAPGSFNSALSPAVERVLLRALSLKPEERFEHIMAFSDNYLGALMGFPVKESEPRPSSIAVPPILNRRPAETPSAMPAVPRTPPLALPEVGEDKALPNTPQPEVVQERTRPRLEIVRRKAAEEPRPAPSLEQVEESTPESEVKRAQPKVYDPRLEYTISNDLRQGGVLSRSLPGYEERVAQMEMANTVARALTQNVPAIVEAATGTGKALDVETPIPTPDGWKPMGDLVVGDTVFDESGQPTRVSAAFEVMHDRPCYEVRFSDGSILIADAEHEWVSYTCADRIHVALAQTKKTITKNFVTADKLSILDQLMSRPETPECISVDGTVKLIGGHRWSVFQEAKKLIPIEGTKRPTLYPSQALLIAVKQRLAKDLVEQRRDGRAYTLITTEKMAVTLTVGTACRANHAVAVAGPLTLANASLPIAPYFLGAWLGDGTSTCNQITTADPDLITQIEKDGYTVRSLRSSPYLYAVDDENGKAVNRWKPGMTGRLRTLGVLQNKHIPTAYLRASIQQRRDLLAGLLDTDGTVNRDGAVEFTTTTPQLAQNIYELVCSLGFRPALREGRARLRGKDCGPKWTIAFTTEEPVFHLPRKLQAQQERLRNYTPERNKFRYVVAVEPVPSRPVRCIQVEAESHQYLAGRSMIPTHNSLAYLVPTVRSGKVAIVSTANKALQEQLFYKDIPFIQQHIKDFHAALVKGASNYVCLDRLDGERMGMQYFAKNREFERLYKMTTDHTSRFSGDFETLTFPLPGDIRGRINADTDQCAWSKCNFYSECYVRQMREEAELAQIIVVNHTLLLIDAAMGGFLLPDRDVIILDEAHHLEEEATRSFTTTISPQQITSLLNQRMLKDHSTVKLQDEALRTANLVWERLEQVTELGNKGRCNLESPLQEGLRLATVLADLCDSLRRNRPKDMPEKEGQLYEKLLKRTQNLSESVRSVFSVANTAKFVYYVERVEGARQSGALQASAAPLDVTTWLRERLFDKSNVICTSATLATVGPSNGQRSEEKGPNFSYFRKRVGIDAENRPEVIEKILPLTFDYESNALLYIPRDLPQPTFGDGSDDYMTAIAREMYRLVRRSHGRAFLLFSNKRMLDHAYELMEEHLLRLGYPPLKQGTMARLTLLKNFREQEGAVLFGLKSFWEGVDIAGEQLSLVVIDKLPFDPPDDPVHEARVAQMKAAGENWFGTYVLPQAVLRLKQGLGRLLRTREDRGVMAILDTRLYTKGYGKLVLDALPPARRTSNLNDVERFFG